MIVQPPVLCRRRQSGGHRAHQLLLSSSGGPNGTAVLALGSRQGKPLDQCSATARPVPLGKVRSNVSAGGAFRSRQAGLCISG